MEEPHPIRHPQIPSPCSSSGRRNCNTNNSPEFEFWMVRNPSFPQPNLLSADELFSDGFLLPLHLLQLSTDPPPPPSPSPPPPQLNEETEPDNIAEPEASTAVSALNSSKRWRHIFRKNDNSISMREKKSGGATGVGAGKVVGAAELNINIWPFSRSRSAGNGAARPPPPPRRKASSAPCSRSNSTGESKSRKWAHTHSPNRGGVHLGRNSPVWQFRRGGGRSSEAFAEKGGKRDGNDGRRKFTAPKARVLSLNVPMCIGYRGNLSCRYDESGAVSVDGSQIERGVAGEGIRRSSSLFNIRSLFTTSKKVH